MPPRHISQLLAACGLLEGFLGAVGIRVLCGAGNCSAPDASVTVSPTARVAALANTKMALDPPNQTQAPQYLQLRLVVDGASLELFVNGGLASVAAAAGLSPLALQRAATGLVRVFAAGADAGRVTATAEAHTLG